MDSNRPSALHVSLFLPSLEIGGAERAFLRIGEGMAELGASVDLVVARAFGPLIEEVPQSVSLVDLGAGSTLRALPALTRFIRSRRPTAVVSAMEHANIIAFAATRLARTPTRHIPSVRTNLSAVARETKDIKNRLVRLLVRPMYRSANRIVAVSAGVKRDLTAAFGVDPQRIKVIGNPTVDASSLSSVAHDANHPWLGSGQPPVIIAVGRLHSVKDFATLIRAFAKVRDSRECRLMIIGDGPERHRLESLISELGLAEDVQLTGFMSNPTILMNQSRVFVLSSIREGMPNALIEAMACGLGVVATDCPSGPSELLENGKLGSLVPVGDVVAMAQGIREQLDSVPDPRLREKAVREFGVERIAGDYLKVVADTLCGSVETDASPYSTMSGD